MGRIIRQIRHFGHIAFVIYLSFVALIPLTHSHAAEASSENTLCSPAAPLFNDNKCCEFHESGHEEDDTFHIHFLADNQTAPTRYSQNDISPASQDLAALDDGNITHFQHEGVGAVLPGHVFYQEALRPFFSGLSPPLS